MNVAVDDSILANIKTQQESDGEDAGDVAVETFMEVLGGFAAGGIEEANLTYGERNDDPLEDDEEASISRMEFPWYCEENDFLEPYAYDGEPECHDAIHRASKSKKVRTEEELKGSNGLIWRRVPPSPPIADDLSGFMPSGKGPAKSVANPLEAWHLLMDVPMLNQVVKGTNEIIKAAKKKEPHQKRLTDLTELKAWLGLHYLCGVLRNSCYAGPTEELWTLELGNAIFRATMTYKRFEFLSDSLRYADKSVDGSSPLEEVASMWEKLVINCRSYYAPSDFCMIDEHILDFGMDTCNPFDHALARQPSCKGIRIITKCDAKTLYISNALVATHSQPIDQEVYQLVSDIKGTRRCLCMTERFSTMGLMQKLKQCQLQVVGALLQTAKDIPPELCSGCQVPQVWYAENDSTLIGCLDKCVTPTKFLLTNGLSARLNAVKLYQRIKNSNCKAHEQMNSYSTKHAQTRKRKWTSDFFYFMLDVSAFNAWILFRLSQNGCAGIEQRDFQRQLGLYLTQQQLKQRTHLNIKLPLPLKLQIAEILGENVESLLNGVGSRLSEAIKLGSIPVEKASIPEGIVIQPREIDNRRRCRGCKSRKGTKIKTRCQECLIPFCMRHLISRCESCSNYELHQSKESLSKSEDLLTPDTDTLLK